MSQLSEIPDIPASELHLGEKTWKVFTHLVAYNYGLYWMFWESVALWENLPETKVKDKNIVLNQEQKELTYTY